MVKLLALHQDMCPDLCRRRLAIPGFERRDNGFMLGHGLPQAPPEAKLDATERLQTPVQTQALLFQKHVA